ncbi:hypothetical protein FRZ44_32020 [Hypericibacter terrae]|uniref:Uncharacterized protein n=1 Tax=Hypericibacter terrae TaxID=2602015 RepID=A0A5J6MKK9_9PROT|nr:hypothetical protein FRZ44_32020 [Hypericibacter terrae]
MRYNPLNVVFNPDSLTDRGLILRTRLWKALLVFVGSIAAGGAIRIMAHLITAIAF